MRFEWDEAKRESNIGKHGLYFADLEPLFNGETALLLDDRFDYGEQRFVTIGLLNGVVLYQIKIGLTWHGGSRYQLSPISYHLSGAKLWSGRHN
jgi:hypothetical protein